MSASASFVVVLAPPGLQSLADEEHDDPERGDRIGPPPPQEGVEADTREDDDREVPAGLRLLGVRRPATDLDALAPVVRDDGRAVAWADVARGEAADPRA